MSKESLDKLLKKPKTSRRQFFMQDRDHKICAVLMVIGAGLTVAGIISTDPRFILPVIGVGMLCEAPMLKLMRDDLKLIKHQQAELDHELMHAHVRAIVQDTIVEMMIGPEELEKIKAKMHVAEMFGKKTGEKE